MLTDESRVLFKAKIMIEQYVTKTKQKLQKTEEKLKTIILKKFSLGLVFCATNFHLDTTNINQVHVLFSC